MSPLEKFLLHVALPTVIIASLAEALVLARRTCYHWKAMGVSLFDLIGRTAVSVLLPLSIATPLVNWAWEHRIATITLDAWQALALLVFSLAFCYYWYHRAAHRVRWFWGNHAVHHSPNELNLSAAYRISMFGRLAPRRAG